MNISRIPFETPLFTNPSISGKLPAGQFKIKPNSNTNSVPPVTPLSVSIPIMVPVTRKIPLSRPVRPIIPPWVRSWFRKIPSRYVVVCCSSRAILWTPRFKFFSNYIFISLPRRTWLQRRLPRSSNHCIIVILISLRMIIWRQTLACSPRVRIEV